MADAAGGVGRTRLAPALPHPQGPATGGVPAAEVATALEQVVADLGTHALEEARGRLGRALLDEQLERNGATAAEFNGFIAQPFVAWSPSASAGKPLRSLNDHAGVLVVAARDGNHTVAERLAVIKQPVDGEDRYFVKGYGDRIVPFDDLSRWIANHQDAAAVPAPGVTPMETALRTELRRLSEASELFARRSERESQGEALMNPPTDLAAMPRPASWANSEHALPKGFGPIAPTGADRRGEPARSFFMDYNVTENRIILFKRDEQALERQIEAGRPTAVNVNGPVMAEIHGIRSIEVMSPAGVEPGVTNATLGQLWNAMCGPGFDGDRVLHVTTEDGAVHRLRLNDRGVAMQLLNPKPSAGQSAAAAAFGGGRGVGADVDVYSYRGIDTGPAASADGFPDPQLVLSSGESLRAGPLMHDGARIVKGNLTGLLHSAARLLTFTPAVGGNRSFLMKAVDTVVVGVVKSLVVAGSNAVLQELQSRHDNGTLFGKGQSFSGLGSGQTETDDVARAIFFMVLAQQGVTAAFQLADRVLAPLLPHAMTGRRNPGSTALMDLVVPAAQEMVRLSVNYGIQRDVGLPRGGKEDFKMLAPQAAVNGLIEFTRRRAGEPQNHPVRHAGLHLLDVANDITFRSLGMVLSSKDYDKDRRAIDLREAAVSRLVVRGADRLVLPMVAGLLNDAGVIGPNASAFDHQDARESGLRNVVGLLKFVLDGAATKVANHVEQPALQLLESVTEVLRKLHIGAHQTFVRAEGVIAEELAEAGESARHPEMSVAQQRAHLARLQARFDEMIEQARGDGPAPVTNARSGLPGAHRDYMAQLDAAVPADPERRYRVFTDATGRARPSSAAPRTVGKLALMDTARVPRDVSTFSLSAQRGAKAPHAVMKEAPGLASIDNIGLSKTVLAHIKSAVRDYTEESQYFHYPLRWDVTGQPQRVEIAPGIGFDYKVMNKPNNTTGDPTRRFDPIGALYMNLGALHADKYPALVQRAVGTEARYGVPRPTQPPTELVQNEDFVALTEILSATTSSRLAAAFGQALAFGALPKDRSQRLVMEQQSAVNITRYTDLVQAEVIAMPGGMFSVRHIDAEPRKQPGDDSADIGQVVYMQAVDTAALERRHPAYYGPGENPPALQDGDLAIHPHTGHLYRWDGEAGRLRYEATEKNYFLGRSMERTRQATVADAQRMPGVQPGEALPASELALWRHPYTADGAKRTTKDAIHAAIVRGDPIVEHLDDAVLNVHHQHFREMGGFELSHAAHEEHRARGVARAQATQLSREIARLRMDTPLAGDGAAGDGATGIAHSTLAWLATSLLRRPLQLVPVRPPDTPGGAPTIDRDQATLVAMTYDKVNLAYERPTALGVGPDGFYALKQVDGSLTAQRIEANTAGPTVGNFLHAVVHAGYEDAGSYREVEGGLRPDGSARRGAAKLLEKIQALSATRYHPLEAAMVEEARRHGWQPRP
ncbi:MAG TPA: hypothetical protein VFR90_14275 [Methylibium sp.]|uniref:hypothetical protein n=1 Tax=Methylibium sp. TaxID=2067992 RepID=UPI002DB655D5|nr:hypothetical protein [Methylibium sp.]HEU4460282.1 hypothetical protein [Methylibium sp.]